MKNLKAAVLYVRQSIKYDIEYARKVKQFNALPYIERQKLSNKLKGFKQSLPWLMDSQKIQIIDKMKAEKVEEYVALKAELETLEKELNEVDKPPLEGASIVEVTHHVRRTLSSSDETNKLVRANLKAALEDRIAAIKLKMEKL